MATSVPDTSDPVQKLENFNKFWKGKKTRTIVFVINNYDQSHIEALRSHGATCRHLVFGYELAPTTGTPHLQCFICWDNPHSILAFAHSVSKKPFDIQTVLKGTHQQASAYCAKPESKDPSFPAPGFEEFGECPRQGARTDFAVALEQIKSGTPVEEVVDSQPQLLPMIRALDSYKSRLLKPLNRPVNVIVLWGDAGSGKSKWAYDNYPELYSKSNTKWWDGYTGQLTLLLEEYELPFFTYTEFLKVLDRYPYQCEIKGGFVWAQYTTVIITANKPPEQWYQKGITPALRRRLDKIFFYSIDASPQEYSPTPQGPKGSQSED